MVAHSLRSLRVAPLLLILVSACAKHDQNRESVVAVPAGTPTPAASSKSSSAGPSLRLDAPERYVVQSGDTLWDISNRYLADPWYWPEIWSVNPQVRNPHLIYRGYVLEIVDVQG